MNQSDYRPVDKVVGIILLIYSLCGAMCGGIVLGGGGILAAVGVQEASRSGASGSAAPLGLVAGFVVLFGGIILAAYLLNVAGAIGVMKSQRWGFILSAILTGITALAGLSGATGFLNLLPDAAACIYCILRVNGTWGPKPT